MTNTKGRLVALASAALIALAVAASGGGGVVHVTIVHTNDLHGHVENAPAVAIVEREAKAKNPNTLFLDAGDAVSGTPVSTLFKGEPVFEVMSLMGYDAGAIGNHEFDHGWKQTAKFRDLATHPLLCANAKDPDGKPLGDEPYHVFALGRVKVGVIGLLTDDMPTLTSKENWAGCSVEAPLAAAKRLVPEIRKQCDVVVLLTHVGVEVDAAIAGAVPGIDLIVGGHSHTEIPTPLIVTCGDRRVPIVQAKCNGLRVGIVEFDWDPSSKTVVGLTGRLVPIYRSKSPEAPDVKRLVDQWLAKAREKVDLGEVIGKTNEKLTRDALRAAIERIFAEALDADFGYENLHGVRADVDAGDIRVESVWKVLPFDNALVKIRLRGSQIPEWARRRLGKQFDPSKEYVFATNSYVGDQQKKYFGVEGAPVEKTDLAMRDTVVSWVREHGGFEVDAAAPSRGDDEEEKR
jgi:2',3'-cyclic-nucleotide 2'-phosphodiesterase (5'-nucleotidase family)